jgi:hypothetical protein
MPRKINGAAGALTEDVPKCNLQLCGGAESVRGRRFFVFILMLAGCADSETRSIVSSDLAGNKYRRIAVFVENSNPMSPSRPLGAHTFFTGSSTDGEIEQKVVAALDGAGVKASGGPAVFNGQTLSNQVKATVIQKNFDAVLYVAVVTNGKVTTRVEGASHNGQYLFLPGADPEPIDDTIAGMYDLRSDGSVWGSVPTFQAKCDLQDTKTNKVVWSSETITTGGTLVVLSRASEQIVSKMRSDGAI